MSGARLLRVAALDLRHNLGRPMFWILILILGLISWGLSTGHMRISSGDSTVGGTKAWLTSEFAFAQTLSFVVVLFYSFFVSVAAGMTVIEDDERNVGPLLHATPLRPFEYFYGKFLAVILTFLGILALHVLFAILFLQLVPSAAAEEIRGPFAWTNYLRPVLLFALPTVLFFAGVSFAIGIGSRTPILVTVLPLVIVIASTFILWEWSPSWLDPRINRLMMVLDPGGFRWLNETWLRVDRGVEFYNTAPMSFDGTFWANRLVLLGTGLAALVLAGRRFARTLRGTTTRAKTVKGIVAPVWEPASPPVSSPTAEGALVATGMRRRAPGFLRGTWTVVRTELKELRSQAGLYLFVPLILLQTIGSTFFNLGPFDTPLLATPGGLAVATMNTLTLLICLMMLFYTVESLERDHATGLAPISLSTPIRSGSVLLGKAMANGVVGLVVVVAALLASVIVILTQGKVPLSLGPFALVWGLLLFPTFVVWTTFVTAVHALTRNRYTTYGVALGALIFTGYRQATNRMNWAGNWDFWSVLQWSDMGTFEIDRIAIILNRVMVLGLAALFIAMTVRFYARAERDASRTGQRLHPASLLRGALALAPFAVVPALAGGTLYFQVHQGYQGPALEKKEKDYWRRNLATWRDAPQPGLAAVDLSLELDPVRRWLASNGSFTLVNHHDGPLRRFALTRGSHWRAIHWTLDGAEHAPDDRLGLVIFTPERPFDPGDSLRVGFRFEGKFPDGISKNGGGSPEFVLPSGVVLTSFRPSFAPLVGYSEEIGVDDENRYETREYPEDFHEGVTEAAFGSGHQMRTRIEISGPGDYVYNSVGTCVRDEVVGGRRTTVWQSDYPVHFFNVVAGRWAEKRGAGTVVYHHAAHPYNVDEISEALEAARRHYSEWFMPFPWRELKLSEFPALAGYAQGFPTNITFSEALGFLTQSDPRANLAFMVTAHEAAHQWWGNLLLPGKGPGGNILSEGMAHFSTILLFEEVKGLEQRIEFCKRIESRYGDRRQVDSERALVRIDGSKRGDQTVTYDKGGWVFWMLLQHMGRERTLAGIQEFITRFSSGPDRAVLQDLVAVLRGHAADIEAYDAFVRQWFFEVVVPEYRLTNAHRAEVTSGSAGGLGETEPRSALWEATVEVKNRGAGTMPVEIAAARGERFLKPQASGAVRMRGSSASSLVPAADVDGPDGYRDVRTRVVLAAGETATVVLRCPFRPERILVDPDALVLQLNRESAAVRF